MAKLCATIKTTKPHIKPKLYGYDTLEEVWVPVDKLWFAAFFMAMFMDAIDSRSEEESRGGL